MKSICNVLSPLLQLKITQRTREIEEQKVKLERVAKQILKLVKEIKSKKGSAFSAVEEVCKISLYLLEHKVKTVDIRVTLNCES